MRTSFLASGRWSSALVVCATLASLVPLPAVADNRVAIGTALVHPGSTENSAVIERLMSAAASHLNARYADFLSAEVAATGAADFSVAITAVFADEPADSALTFVMTRSRDGAQSDSGALLGTIAAADGQQLAGQVFQQWASFAGYLQSGMVAAPELVAEIAVDALGALLPGMPIQLYPQGATTHPSGDLLVGFGSVGARLDSVFRLVDRPGRALSDDGNFTYAGGVAATPSGTIFYKPGTGRDIFRVVEGAPRPQRWSIGQDTTGPFAALGDGSVVVTDIVNRRSFRVQGRKRYEFNVYTSQYSYVAGMAVGPEGNLWVYDAFEKRLRIHAPDGTLIDSVVPIIDPADAITPTSLAVYANGSFVLGAQHLLLAFRRNGTPLWRLDTITTESGFEEQLPLTSFVAVDPHRALVYVVDTLGRRIMKLVDWATAEALGAENALERRLAGLAAEAPAAAAAAKAAIYEQAGALHMAEAQWQRVLDEDPFDQRAADELDRLQVELRLTEAAELEMRTRQTLRDLGPESARAAFSQTVQIYERVLSIAPNHAAAAKSLQQLREAFAAASGAAPGKKPPITISALHIENLFPSLMQHYRDHPVGSIEVLNTLEEPITDLRASLSLRRYTDFPTETALIAQLAPGASASLDLSIILNEAVFDIQEHLPVQAQVVVSYSVGGQPQEVVRAVPVTLQSRTALTWDESAKLASFITPNEGIVSAFAHRVSRVDDALEVYRLSNKLFQAMRVCDAVGTHSVHYVEDPESPITQILGNNEWVDTVRFPRTTLLIQAGDCDDTSALLASLLESIGIRTAIMTSPGHVFMAFDSGEPEENMWLFQSLDLEAVAHAGRAWIPVETTVLSDGFLAAWLEASRLIRTHGERGDIEFLPVHEARDAYPPLSLPRSTFAVVEPLPAAIDELFDASVEGVVETLYANGLATLRQQLAGRSGTDALKVRNQIGILHARFGEDAEAERTFASTITTAPEFIPAYVNMANLRQSAGDFAGAIDVLEEALQYRADSIYLNLALARSHFQSGAAEQASRYFALVRERAPSLAERYAYIDAATSAGGDAVARAGAPGAGEPLIWAVE